jgi:hypothetical protein
MFPPDENWVKFWGQVLQVLTKTIFPAIVAVSVGIAVRMQQKKVTLLSAVCSFVSGCGLAYITGFYIENNYPEDIRPILIGAIAILGDRFILWLIYKFEIDAFMETIMQLFFNKKK